MKYGMEESFIFASSSDLHIPVSVKMLVFFHVLEKYSKMIGTVC
jgi:hypothetical protein